MPVEFLSDEQAARYGRYHADHGDSGRPPLYVRELPVAVHTKFIEEHEVGLAALLRELLPGYLNPAGKSLAARLRLREPEHLVYVRVLDPQLSASLPFGLTYQLDQTVGYVSLLQWRAGLDAGGLLAR